ncbi:MAG: DUF881 domain-containing protein [Clostridium sp.]
MKNNEAAIFVFVASVVMGILISMNLNFGSNSQVFLNVEEYNEAYNKRNTLYKEVTTLMDKYEESVEKLADYKIDFKNDKNVIAQISQEYHNFKIDMGLEAVHGEGIRIILNDATNIEFGQYHDATKLVHDYDLLYIINDLRNAGAEAIAINGHRIVFDTDSLCTGVTVDLGGIKVVAPFYITAIGNKSVMNSYMIESNSYYKRLSLTREIERELQQMDNIEIPAYNGVFSDKYMNKRTSK